jgi:protease I
LGADAISAYASMQQDDSFRRPITWAALADGEVDALVLPGGHAPGMREYLESPHLQAAILSAMAADRPVAAICHGVLLMARTIDPSSGRSVLWGRRTTALPRNMEMSAWGMTCTWLGSYYRTYPETVEDEVTRALVRERDFDAGPMSTLRDAPEHLDRGFFVLDNNYLSARWPGDAYAFSAALLRLL